jgi:hypothetical protein
MQKIFIALCLLHAVVQAQEAGPSLPKKIDPAGRYLFYLHGAVVSFVGDNGINNGAPEYGPYQYSAILDSLRRKGFNVISEIRQKDLDNAFFVAKIAAQIDTLLRAGVKAENIVVLGASAGWDIGIRVSDQLKNKDLRFVIMGGCWPVTWRDYVDIDLYGHFLSIIESTDPHATCYRVFEGRKHLSSYQEIKLNTGLSHGFFYRGRAAWMDPLMNWFQQKTDSSLSADICIYGATSAGIIAAYTAKKLGKSVIVLDAGKHIGGLTTGGLGFTDIGNKYAVTGLGLDYYRRMGKRYGKFESWIFEPHVAAEVFKEYMDAAGIKIYQQHELQKVISENKTIRELEFSHALANGYGEAKVKVRAKVYIDCTYEGDLMAKAGVSYTVGRESNAQYGETYNGVQLRDKHQFPEGVDPYKIPGRPGSGLLWGISPEAPDAAGTGDKKVQAYNFRICLTDNPANRIPITRPENYDSTRYELLLRLLEKKPAGNLQAFLKIDRMPNRKTDINNNGAFSTDMIGMNYDYPEADAFHRKMIMNEHADYVKGLIYFIGHDPRMPAHLQEEMMNWGYPKDEYVDNDHWSPQMYVREARRMIGEYVMTQANCEGNAVVTDGIGMAAYTMDSHNCQRIVVNGMVKNEGDVQIGGFGPYPVSYRSIIPKTGECNNLFVPVCLSASHIAYGSIRMEPVFMVLAQASAVGAVEAVNSGSTVQEVNVSKVQQVLKANPLADGSEPEILIDNADSAHVRITGAWTLKRHVGFGPSVLAADASSKEKRQVRFIPAISRPGYYKLYTYFLPNYQQLASKARIIVFDGKKQNKVPLMRAELQVQGQTSGEWLYLGRYRFNAGNKSWIAIDATGADGAVVADAVLLVPDGDK